MPEAIADTGPIRHLHEIGRLEVLVIFNQLTMPELVADELRIYGIEPLQLGVTNLNVTIADVARADWEPILSEARQPIIHPADAQVFALAQLTHFRSLVLIDDLALRRRLESQGAMVVGTVGILVRAYTTGRLRREELDRAIDALFTQSTLHMSRAFRAYIHNLLTNLP